MRALRFAKADATPFAVSFDIPFHEAIRQSQKRKVVLPSIYYGEMQGVARMRAFSVAGIAAADQLQHVLDTLNESLAKGQTFAEWKAAVQQGEHALDLPAHRLDNIFRTNIQSAYSAGRWTQQRQNLKVRPFLMYDAINDSRVRPAHLAMDGYIAQAGDAIWETWYPPCGYRCRCTTISLTETQAKARGLDKMQTPTVQPDPGWDYDRREGAGSSMEAARVVAKARTKSAPVAKALERVEKVADKWDSSTWNALPDTQRGSNPGGLFEAPDGTRFYVKFPKDIDQAKGEVAAAGIYKAMGVKTVEPRLVTINGKLGIASEFRTDLVAANPEALLKNPEQLARIFHGSVVTKNWDVTGLSFDNIMLDAQGNLVVVDTGATFYWRAQGARKPFAADIAEVKSLIDPKINAQGARVFGEAFRRDVFLEKRGARAVMDLSRDTVEAEFLRVGFAAEEVDTLTGVVMERRSLLADRYDLNNRRTFDGFGKLVDELAAKHGTSRYNGTLMRGEPNDPAYLRDFQAAMATMESMLEREAFKGATESIRILFRANWSGSSSAAGSAAIKMWAKERFNSEVGFHGGKLEKAAEAAAEADLAKVLKAAKITKEQMFRALDVEYEFHQYMLRRLHGWDTFQIQRGMSPAEFTGNFKADDPKRVVPGSMGTFTFNGAASTTTKSSVFNVGYRVLATVYVEDFLKTWYQGAKYMHYGNREAEYVIIGRRRVARAIQVSGRSENTGPLYTT